MCRSNLWAALSRNNRFHYSTLQFGELSLSKPCLIKSCKFATTYCCFRRFCLQWTLSTRGCTLKNIRLLLSLPWCIKVWFVTGSLSAFAVRFLCGSVIFGCAKKCWSSRPLWTCACYPPGRLQFCMRDTTDQIQLNSKLGGTLVSACCSLLLVWWVYTSTRGSRPILRQESARSTSSWIKVRLFSSDKRILSWLCLVGASSGTSRKSMWLQDTTTCTKSTWEPISFAPSAKIGLTISLND